MLRSQFPKVPLHNTHFKDCAHAGNNNIDALFVLYLWAIGIIVVMYV